MGKITIRVYKSLNIPSCIFTKIAVFLDQEHVVELICLDFREAFERMSPRKLLAKLKAMNTIQELLGE